MTTADANAIRDRSYDVRVRPGDRVRLLHDVRNYRNTIPAGSLGTALNESNAGFRGIEAYVEFDNYLPPKQDWMSGQPSGVTVSTGKLEII